MIVLSFLFIFLRFKDGMSQDIGECCRQDGAPGVCVTLGRCPSVLADPSKRKNAKRCGFCGNEPIICCTDRELNNRFLAPPPPIRTTTTEYTSTIAGYKKLFSRDNNNGNCAPIPAMDTAQKTGRKALDKCIEYQAKFVYPCEERCDNLGKLERKNNCKHAIEAYIIGVGGKDAGEDEFPHMALLGFGDGAAPESALCGGTIISENFILTAGHCTSAPYIGPVTTAKVGVLRLSEEVPACRVYRIKKIIKHPQYKAPSKYHDIALLETEKPITLDRWTVPACLDIGDRIDDSRASATGWGRNDTFGQVLDVLQKVKLQKFTAQECAASVRGIRNLDHGYDERTQICYGDHQEQKDTCHGDSGGPLQIHNDKIHCMYTVIGVTSFGKYCGQVGRPGFYTRVSAYTSWIESVVWP